MSDNQTVSREECEDATHSQSELVRRLARAHLESRDEIANLKRDKERLERALEIEDEYFLDIALTLEDSDISQLCVIAAGIRETLKNRKIAIANIEAREAIDAAMESTASEGPKA